VVLLYLFGCPWSTKRGIDHYIFFNKLNFTKMKTIKLVFVAIVIIASYNVRAQVAITIDGSNADGSAMLDVKSTDKGILISRMTKAQREAISSPATGLQVYQTDNTPGFYYYNGSAWTAVTKTYQVGEFVHGGIVFWVDATGQNGLVCAKTDQYAGMRWYAGTSTNTVAYGDGPLSGEMNTAIIIANQGYGDGSTYAARICMELQNTEGGKTYGDWYLPSIQELILMYQNKAVIDVTATANGGSAIATTYYWSSTEFNGDYAFLQDFSDGFQYISEKPYGYYVRAVRAF